MTDRQMEEIASRFDQAQAGSLYALEDGNSFKAGYEAGRITGMAEAIQVLADDTRADGRMAMEYYDAIGQPIDEGTRDRWRRNGARLRAMREARGVSLPELAEKYGMDACDWQLAEMGLRDFHASEIVEAMQVFGVGTDAILAGYEA